MSERRSKWPSTQRVCFKVILPTVHWRQKIDSRPLFTTAVSKQKMKREIPHVAIDLYLNSSGAQWLRTLWKLHKNTNLSHELGSERVSERAKRAMRSKRVSEWTSEWPNSNIPISRVLNHCEKREKSRPPAKHVFTKQFLFDATHSMTSSTYIASSFTFLQLDLTLVGGLNTSSMIGMAESTIKLKSKTENL